jgi:hypothetical protein
MEPSHIHTQTHIKIFERRRNLRKGFNFGEDFPKSNESYSIHCRVAETEAYLCFAKRRKNTKQGEEEDDEDEEQIIVNQKREKENRNERQIEISK